FLFVGILAALWLGRWLGKRAVARDGPAALPSVGSLETAVLALLGLLSAFSFSGALSRFDSRPALAVGAAIALGPAYVPRALVQASAQPKLNETFRKYLDPRIETYRLLPDIVAAKASLTRSEQLQGEIWSQAIAAVRSPGSPLAAELLVLPALNDVFN